jgi:hypothetical protein
MKTDPHKGSAGHGGLLPREPDELIRCPLERVRIVPPPLRAWPDLIGSNEDVALAEAIRQEKLQEWNLPSYIHGGLMSVTDSAWWIINRSAKTPEDILWPKWWIRPAGPTPDPFKTLRDSLRFLISPNTADYKRRHWLCERCRECESSRVWHIEPTFGEFASVVADWLGPEQGQSLGAISHRSWPEEMRSAILEAHREKCKLMAVCKGCLSGIRTNKSGEEQSMW